MKIVYFIKWLYSKAVNEVKRWDRWHWSWMVTCGWGTNAIMFRDQNPNNFFAFLIFVSVFWIGYGIVYTGIKTAYRKFQEEQTRIVDHLKDIG